jgi:hypothetical protein
VRYIEQFYEKARDPAQFAASIRNSCQPGT